MSINERNRKVALSRWNRIHEKEKSFFRTNKKNLHLKARIIGYLAGDGSVLIRKEENSKRHFIVKYHPDHESIVIPFVEAFRVLYNKEPLIKKNKKYFSLICYSKTIVEDLLNTTTFGHLKWRAPFKILRTKNAKAEWLRAIFDTEGYVGKKHIKIQSVNAKGIKDIETLLSYFNIKSKLYRYKPKNKNWNTVYMLFINRNSDKIKFLNKIGFNHEVKMSRLREYAGIA